MIEIIPASPDQEPVLANLLELYAHDFSEFRRLPLGADGRFGYKSLPLYWEEPGRHAFLIKVHGELAGVVLVKRGSEICGDENVWDIAEFFLVRGHRRRGIGTEVAHRVWKAFPGSWEVRVMDSNRFAKEFWRRAIASFLGAESYSTPFAKNGEQWHLFSFESIGGCHQDRPK